MEAIIGLLSPAQIDFILESYDSVELWFEHIATNITEALEHIGVEDVIF